MLDINTVIKNLEDFKNNKNYTEKQIAEAFLISGYGSCPIISTLLENVLD